MDCKHGILMRLMALVVLFVVSLCQDCVDANRAAAMGRVVADGVCGRNDFRESTHLRALEVQRADSSVKFHFTI